MLLKNGFVDIHKYACANIHVCEQVQIEEWIDDRQMTDRQIDNLDGCTANC